MSRRAGRNRPERALAAPVPDSPAPADAPDRRSPLVDTRFICIGIFLTALALRLSGIDWGLPGSDRFFSYHPDESVVVFYSSGLNPFAGKLDPGFYNYGSLSLLLNSVAILLGETLGFSAPGRPGIPPAGAYLAVRMVTATLGSGTAVFMTLTGTRLWSIPAGVVAGLLYAIAPLAVQHGHFATVDVPATFWISGALFFAARHLDTGGTRSLLWCGLWAGLAAATKYNAGLVILAGGAAWWLAPPRSARGLGVLAIAAAGGFAIGCPAIFLNPGGLIEAIRFEARHVATGHGMVFTGTPPALVYHAIFNLRWGLGLPLLLVTGAGVIAAGLRRRRADIILLAFLIPYYLLIGMAQVKFARYTLPLFPPLLLLAGAILTPIGTRSWRVAAGAAGAAAALYALLLSLALNQAMSGPDPRDSAARFIRSLGPKTIGFATGPWYYTPPLSPGFASFNPQAAKQYAAVAAAPRMIPAEGEWNTSQLRSSAPDTVPLSEFEYADPLRLRLGSTLEYLRELDADLPNRQVFAHPLQVFGIRFTNIDSESDLPLQHLPHDMLYTNATVVVRYR